MTDRDLAVIDQETGELVPLEAIDRWLAEVEDVRTLRLGENAIEAVGAALAKEHDTLARGNQYLRRRVEVAVKIGRLLGPAEDNVGGRGQTVSCGEQFPRVERHKYRQIAGVAPDKRESYYRWCEDNEEEIAKAGVLRVAKGDPFAKQWTGNKEWYTPAVYIEAARAAMGSIDLDPASNDFAQKTVQAASYYTQDDNGLEQPWAGNVFLNPPYKMPAVRDFINRLVEHHATGEVPQAILLTNNATDTGWFKAAAGTASVVCFTYGRISFYDQTGERSAPTNGQCFFYFGQRRGDFLDRFVPFGLCMERCRAS